MSATNRGSLRHPADFYATPSWCVDRLLEKLKLPGGNWLEPGAGEGNLIRAVNRSDVRWTALELREECRPILEALSPRPEIVITDKFVAAGVEDRAKPLHGRHFDVAFGNPPFSLAIEFVRESIKYADHVVMLLRLNFLGSRGRCAFMQEHAPDVYVLPDRPSFDGKGTDSIEYAWFVWRRATLHQPSGRITVLDVTSADTKHETKRLTLSRAA
jgi:hypothetical protein